MAKTSQEYKDLSIKEFTKAATVYDRSKLYGICKRDYPDILAEIEKEPFESLLDAGCGPAPMLCLLSEKYPDKHYTGLDLTPAMIEAAKSYQLPNTELIVGDCENLPFEANTFDVVICSMSAHHYPNIQNFYNSVYKVLKPNGRFILRDMTTTNKALAWFANNIEMPLANMVGHGDVKMLDINEVKEGMEKAGLKVEISECRKPLRLHVVARKPQ